MKKKELEKKLVKLGWQFSRHGGRHDIWTNRKEHCAIPRHNEIAEPLARKILRTAVRYKGTKDEA